MTAFTSRTSIRQGPLWDVAAIWVTLTVTLAYLDVPIVNAPLFATALVLQAALGTWVVTKLLRGAQPSLLMLLGPGLILGGALSFAIFQVVGRGVVGVVITTLAGLSSVGLLMRSAAPEVDVEPRWWMLGQLLGMSVLAIASEFTELLPIAIAFFGIGFLMSPGKSYARWRILVSCMIGAGVAGTSLLLRHEYWWLITDDYQFLEIVTRHVVVEGPFAKWGVTSFSNYHWLSYGWAGLIDITAGSPEPLVTLTRVMPILYSFSLSASLTLLLRSWRAGSVGFADLASVWAVIGVVKIDWSGTSTGGVYATVAALGVLLLLARDRPFATKSICVIVLMLIVVTLTKLPALFAAVLLSSGFVIPAVLRNMDRRKSQPLRIFLSSLVLPSVVTAIWLSTVVVPGRFRFVATNPQLGQLALFGPEFASVALVLNQIWIWLAIVCLLVLQLGNIAAKSPRVDQFALTLLFAAVGGVALEVVITSNADNHKYFSGPMYLVAAFSFLKVVGELKDGSPWGRNLVTVVSFGLLPILVGVTWFNLEAVQGFWNGVGSLTGTRSRLEIELLKFVTNDGRFAASVIFALAVLTAAFFVGLSQSVKRAFAKFMIVLTVLSFVQLSDGAVSNFQNPVSSAEVIDSLGSASEREVADWLKSNTGDTDLIATNHLFGDDGGGVDNMALAVWSRREFLVLGPSLGSRILSSRTSAIQASRSFASNPTTESCQLLIESGVDWFVVDKRLTEARRWSICAKEQYSQSDFTILELIDKSGD